MDGVEQGMPPRDALKGLLQEAFDDDRHTAQRFQWSYEAHPRFDPDELAFYKSCENELVAFIRLIEKQVLLGTAGTARGYLVTDAVVSEAHQGQGHYRDLHTFVTTFASRQGADFLLSYNLQGSITFEAKCRRGFEYVPLPQYLHVFSPRKFMLEYADRVLSDDGLAPQMLAWLGKQVSVRLSDGIVSLAEVLGLRDSSNGTLFTVTLTDRGLLDLVELGNSELTPTALVDALRIVRSEHVSVGFTAAPPQPHADGLGSVPELNPSKPGLETTFVHRSDCDVDQLFRLTTELSIDDYPRFLLERQDIEHLLCHPGAECLVCTQASNFVGAAIVERRTIGDVTEARVLELLALNEAVYKQLLGTLHEQGASRDYDFVIVTSQQRPPGEWAPLERVALMWTTFGTPKPMLPFQTNSFRMQLYDV